MEKGNNGVRKQKLESLLQGMAARFFTLEAPGWGIASMVMVDQVFVTPDLKNAQVWVSFSPHKPEVADKLFDRLTVHAQELQNYIFQQMEIRRVPKISLHLADPTKTFRMMDIFDRLEGDQKPSGSDTEDTSGEQ